MSLRILLATPFITANRGNSITAQRLKSQFIKLRCDARIAAYAEENESAESFEKELAETDVLHLFHAYRFAEKLQTLPKSAQQKLMQFPSIVTMTGTDVNHDIYASYRAKLMSPILLAADSIVVLNEDSKHAMINAFPNLKKKICCIPQGVSLQKNESQRALANLQLPPHGTDSIIILFPAGIRRVKEIAYLFDAFDALSKQFHNLQVWLAGPILEDDYGDLILDHVFSRHYFYYLGEVTHPAMGLLYEKASVVINSSISEGQPQAILEAMSFGSLVAVRDIKGNIDVVADGQNGIVFSSPEDFISKVKSYLKNPQAAAEMKRNAMQHILEKHSPIQEAKAYLQLYRNAFKEIFASHKR